MRWWRRTRTENYSNVIASRWMSTGCVLALVVVFLFPEKNFFLLLLRLVFPLLRIGSFFPEHESPTTPTFITSAMQHEERERKEKREIDLRVRYHCVKDKGKRKESAVAASKKTRYYFNNIAFDGSKERQASKRVSVNRWSLLIQLPCRRTRDGWFDLLRYELLAKFRWITNWFLCKGLRLLIAVILFSSLF